MEHQLKCLNCVKPRCRPRPGLLKRRAGCSNAIRKAAPEKGYVLFQTGYGPSGLPHIGTFGEVARTSMVRHAFEQISDIPTKLICFSDDMDGFRKVPTNVPMQEELKEDLHLPLTKVRDPFGTHDRFCAAQQRDAVRVPGQFRV